MISRNPAIPFIPTQLLLVAWLGMGGCLLPAIEAEDKSADDLRNGQNPPPDACGLSYMLADACDSCIRKSCCALAEDCDEGTECGADFMKQVAPTEDFSESFDPLLACMMDNCDAPCELSWGCVDNYRMPTDDNEVSFKVNTIDYAVESGIPQVEVRACEGVDPSCNSGEQDRDTSDAVGMAELKVPGDFRGYFRFSGAQSDFEYTDATVQWSEPIFRLTDWEHFMITQSGLKGLALLSEYHESVDEEFAQDRGHLIVRIQNCLPVEYLNSNRTVSAEAPNIVFEAMPSVGSSPLYYTNADSFLTRSLTATTIDGVAGAFELPVANVEVVATLENSGQEVARTTIPIRAQQTSFAYLLPRAKR